MKTKSASVRTLAVGQNYGAAALVLAVFACGCMSNGAGKTVTGAGGKGGTTTAGSGGTTGAAGAAGMGGTAGVTGVAGAGAAGAAGGSGGHGGTGGAIATGGAAGASDAGMGDAPAGDGGLVKGTWVDVFNHKDLTNLVTLIHGWKFNDNHYNTFRVDPSNGYLVNSLADYPGGAKGYGGHCGLLYYNKYLTDYALRIEYHFLPSGDGNSNGGMEVFCDDPSKVQGDPMYAPGIEIQVIAQCTNGCGGGTTKAGDGSNNLSICTGVFPLTADITGNPMAGTSNCTPGSYAKLPTRDQWVTIECEIHPGGASKCWDCWEDAPTPNTPFPGCLPDTTQRPEIIFSNVRQKNGGAIAKGGFFAPIQSEGQEQEYRTIQVKDLSP